MISGCARIAASPGWCRATASCCRFRNCRWPACTMPPTRWPRWRFAAASASTPAPAARPAQFRGLPHRVEKIAELDGVSWYDDSKGTNVGATVAALNGIGGQLAAQKSRVPSSGREVGRDGSSLLSCDPKDRKIVVILGGDGKGQDFSPLERAVEKHARAAVLIGRDGPLIEKVIGSGRRMSRSRAPGHGRTR
jgi:hypothetical protein